jgi:hypothetical protein
MQFLPYLDTRISTGKGGSNKREITRLILNARARLFFKSWRKPKDHVEKDHRITNLTMETSSEAKTA